tara:strand:+ start:564 stop:773 length:210 start_codon:yes stop_codon:yes gene_type:complete
MYVMVLVLIMDGGFKVASDQVLYASIELCEASMQTQLEVLNSSKPSPDSFATAACTEVPMPPEAIKPNI